MTVDFQNDLFQERPSEERGNPLMGKVGEWMLHLATLAFTVYSGYHGISASHNYAGNDPLARSAQTVGIVVLEIVLFAIYITWFNSRIVGSEQRIVAGVTFGIGFTLALMTIVTDSQLHAHGELGGVLQIYLAYGLPLAPAVMALGALLVHMLAPHKQRERREADEDDRYRRSSFDADMSYRRQQLNARQNARLLKTASMAQAAKQVANSYNTPAIQRAISTYARQSVPALLSAIGIEVDESLLESPQYSPDGDLQIDFPSPRPAIPLRPPAGIPSVAPSAPPAPAPLSAEQLLATLGGQVRVARELAVEGSAESLWQFYRENGILPDGTARQIFDVMCAPLVAPATPGGNANGEATFRG